MLWHLPFSRDTFYAKFPIEFSVSDVIFKRFDVYDL